MQWAINAYLLTMAALFAFGGRLADTAGHRRMAVLGVVIFAGASALCGLTAVGPIALIALVLIAVSKPANEFRPARMDVRGLVLIVAGVGLSVFGLQQSALWGWGDPAVEACIAAGAVLLLADRAFTVDNLILAIAMMVFIPVFFFASIYGQVALAEKPTKASLLILWFFLGCVLAAVGFYLWATKATDLSAGAQTLYIVLADAGMGFLLGQANTDAVNHASRYSYGEATGITQTVRNYGASLGFAILGTLLISEFRSSVSASLIAKGLSAPAAAAQAAKIAQLQGGSGSAAIPLFIRADFAHAVSDVLYAMAIIMAVAAFVALRGLHRDARRGGRHDSCTTGTRPCTTRC